MHSIGGPTALLQEPGGKLLPREVEDSIEYVFILTLVLEPQSESFAR
jgi:hypothetical protein